MMIFDLGPYQEAVDARMSGWVEERFAQRLRERDTTLWFPGPVPELTDRLGWLSLKEKMLPQMEVIAEFADQVRSEGITDVVLLGMGGSSLASEVFKKTFGSAPGHPELTVLDSTHPAAVMRVRERIDPLTTLFIVSSKSGTTLETISLFRYFWSEMRPAGDERGRHFVAITDPGTSLARVAMERGFRKVFEAPSDVGGRYSALTPFGLVPAALMGVDVGRLLDRVPDLDEDEASAKQNGVAQGLAMGAALGELATSGKDKLTILASAQVSSFPSWIEQLVAESLGKDGRGIIPIIDEPPLDPDMYSGDRYFAGIILGGDDGLEDHMDDLEKGGHPTIRIMLEDRMDLGREIFRWEIAVASAATILGVHPFDQPDVQMSKDLSKKMMVAKKAEASQESERTVQIDEPAELRAALRDWSSQVRSNDYLSIQAYLAPDPETTEGLQLVRRTLLDGLNVASSLDYGPRLLHSTGQLHKGGPNTGLFLQLVEEVVDDQKVPETDYSFGELIRASSLGDCEALRQRGRRVLRIDLQRNALGGLSELAKEIAGLIAFRKIEVNI